MKKLLERICDWFVQRPIKTLSVIILGTSMVTIGLAELTPYPYHVIIILLILAVFAVIISRNK